MNGQNRRIEGGSLEHRILIIPGTAANEGEPAIDKTESSFIDEGGLHESTVLRINYASACNHSLHTGRDIGSTCVACHRLLCSSCSKEKESTCVSCGAAVCHSCGEVASGGVVGAGDAEERGLCCPSCLRAKAWETVRAGVLLAALVGICLFLLMRLL